MLADLAVFLLIFFGLWSLAIARLWEGLGGGPAWAAVKFALWMGLSVPYARLCFGPGWIGRTGLATLSWRGLLVGAAAAALMGILLQMTDASWPTPTPAAVLLPLAGEFTFRGVVQERLRYALGGGAAAAVFMQALLFTAAYVPGWLLLGLHPGPVGVGTMLAVGLAAGTLRAATGSLWPGAILHVVNNLAAPG